MTISEMIEKLKEIQEKEGDVEVLVQYRDDGGAYSGCDEEILFEVIEGDCVIL